MIVSAETPPSAVVSPAVETIHSLYVHVPFCAHKCEYCAFYSEASNGAVIERYVEALLREMKLVHRDLNLKSEVGTSRCDVRVETERNSEGVSWTSQRDVPTPSAKPRTIFFGGGTPSLLNLRQWQRILETMERLELLGAEEWTIESNPATVSADKARLWRDFGVNRVSMGVQSLDEALLDRLGRIHSRQMVFKSFDILRGAGFENLNLDLMFAIPGQTMEIWRSTLREAIALDSEHLSCYEVIYEQDTPLYAQLQAGEFSVDEDLACAMYDELLSAAANAGFEQYEIANFARSRRISSPSPPLEERVGERRPVPAYACQHNINYWRGGSYYGLGPSAAGYLRGVRTKNWSNTQLYCEQLEAGRRPIESQEELSPLRRAGETAAFGLRMNAGWNFDTFRQMSRFDLRTEWASEINDLVQRGWGELTEDRFRLTRLGLRFADAAAEKFLR